MKKNTLRKLIVFCFWIFLASAVMADGSQTEEILKQSLISLKESVKKIYYENKKLEAYNKILLERIEKLKKEYEDLSQKRADLIAGVKNVNETPPQENDPYLYSKKVQRLKKDMDTLKTEEKEYQDRLKKQHEDGAEMKNSLEHNKKVIRQLDKKLEQLNDDLSSEKFKNEIAKLKDQIRDYEKIYKKEEKKLKGMERKQKNPFNDKEKLTLQYQELLKRKEDVEFRVNDQKALETQLQKEMALLKEEDEKKINALTGEIDQLEKEKSDLKEILVKAKNKIEINRLDFDEVLKQEELLKDNLRIIRKDNAFLRETLKSMEEELKVYQSK